MTIQPLIFGAPFGNYFGGDHITRTIGTFTCEKRAGTLYRWWRVIKTVRYSPLLRAWTNKLGLPSPGLDWILGQRPEKIAGTIMSLHGFSTADWITILDRVDAWLKTHAPHQYPLALELNMSCPNVHDDPYDYALVMKTARRVVGDDGPQVIAKIPPVRWSRIVAAASSTGVEWLHCCNTLPVARGGMSGKPLKPVCLQAIEMIRAIHPRLRIIAGGGITGRLDVDDYRAAGAERFAVASVLFTPWGRRRMRKLAAELAKETTT